MSGVERLWRTKAPRRLAFQPFYSHDDAGAFHAISLNDLCAEVNRSESFYTVLLTTLCFFDLGAALAWLASLNL